MLEGSEELVAAQEFLHTLIETMAVPVFIKDKDSTFIGCNNAFADYAGLTVREVIGRKGNEMPWANVAGADYIDWDRRVMSSGIESLGISEPLRLSDGTIRWLEIDKYPLLGTEGQVIGLIGSFRDVTDRVEAERELQRLVGSLDQQVDEQTAELERTNETLRAEMRERERLQIEEREQREQLEVLRDIASALSTTLDLDVVLDEIVTGIQRLLFVDLIAVILAEGDDFAIRRLDVSDEYEVDERVFATRLRDWLHGDSVPGVENGATSTIPLDHCFGIARSAIASVMVVGGHKVGYLVVESRAGHLDSEFSRGRLGAVAGQAAATLSTLRLSTDEADKAAVDERERLAKDLHDTVIQAVSTISLLSDAARGMVDDEDPVAPLLDRMQAAAADSQAEMRNLLLEMRDDQLGSMSARQLVETAIAVFSARSSVEVIADLADVELDEEVSIAIYRIAQEALNNVLHHANATSVSISMTDDPVRFDVRDNGVGFEPTTPTPGHVGLKIMGERASAIGASLTITSSLGGGTDLHFELDRDRPDGEPIELRTEGGAVPADAPDEVVEPARRRRLFAPAEGRRNRPYAVVLWLCIVLLAGGGAFGFNLLRSTAADEAAAELAMVERARVLEARSSIVRPHLEELTARLYEPFDLVAERAIAGLEADRVEIVDQVRIDLEDLADSSSDAGDESRYLLSVLDRWTSEGDFGSIPERLYGQASEMQFDGTGPPAGPPDELDALAELVWADQVAQFVAHESMIARFSQLDDPPEGTEEANEYLGEALDVVLENGGWLGPDASRPLFDGYLPIDAAITIRPDDFARVNDIFAESILWQEDQWIRSLAEDPTALPTSAAGPLVVDASQVVFETRRVVDDLLEDFVERHVAEADEREAAADLYTVLALLLTVTALAAAVRLVVLAVGRGRQLSLAARTDPLTGAGNRKVLEHDTARLLSSSELEHHVIVTIDMDRFKLINDTYGHAFGDRLLRITVDGLRDFADRASVADSTVVRLGGDEFMLSLHDPSPIDLERVRTELDRLRERMVSSEDGSIVHPRFSYGVVDASGSPDLGHLMKASDLAAYEEKARRRDEVPVPVN